jgi:hypothetical protein
MGKGFHAGEEYERPKIYEIDQIAKFQMWLALEVIEQGEFPDSQEVYKVMRMFFAHLLTWDRELQAPLREQIAREIEADPDATSISIKLAAAIARGEEA